MAEPDLDPWGLAVSPRHFGEHLEVLRRHQSTFTVSSLCEALAAERAPAGATVITFDDGYADNLHSAKPLLERYNQRATVFLTTGPIATQREFWWDQLEQIVLAAAPLPHHLEFALPDGAFLWTLEEPNLASSPAARSWRAWQPLRQRFGPHALYTALWQRLYALSHAARQDAIETLAAWAGTVPVPRSSHRPLTAHEIAVLADSELIEVGAHTVNHPALALLTIEEQRAEIERSKADVELLVGTPARSFSYPHGSYTQATVEAVRDAGFDSACTASAGLLSRATDHFQLPRIIVPNCDGDSFARDIVMA